MLPRGEIKGNNKGGGKKGVLKGGAGLKKKEGKRKTREA